MDTAVFVGPVAQRRGPDRVGLWMQKGLDHECIAMFADDDDALRFQSWMDSSLAATGEANRALLEQLSGSSVTRGSSSPPSTG